VSDGALFKAPSVERKRNKMKKGDAKPKQLPEMQLYACKDDESNTAEDFDSDTLDKRSRRCACSFGKVR